MKGDVKTVFMFSGQGSHYMQMGLPLFSVNPIFRKHMLRLDEMARELTGESVVEILYSPANGNGTPFDRTRVTHPAIFMVEYSMAQALIGTGVVPDVVLGTSLGSFVAAALAGFIALEEAVTAVVRHALAMEQHCEPGGMIAVLADPGLYDEGFLRSACDCAAVNFSSHFVVSAPQSRCTNIQDRLSALDIPWHRLAVSHAFHSRWMDPARNHFETFMKSVRIRPGTLPLVCCDRAVTLADMHHGYFWDVTRHPIRFPRAIAGLEQNGPYRYVDAGPSGSLATIMKYVLSSTSRSTVHAILTPYGRDLENWALLAGTDPRRHRMAL
jgi:bacillaene synthase trans-acting acyltransferase